MKQSKDKPISNGGETSPAKKPEGLTILELVPIKAALELLSKKQSALGYQWAKNLALVTSVIKAAAKAKMDARETLHEKDPEGNTIQYLAKLKDGTYSLVEDNGKRVIWKKGQKLADDEGTMAVISAENLEKWEVIQKDYNQERHVIQWHKIDEDRMETIAKTELIEGELLAPLIGIII